MIKRFFRLRSCNKSPSVFSRNGAILKLNIETFPLLVLADYISALRGGCFEIVPAHSLPTVLVLPKSKRKSKRHFPLCIVHAALCKTLSTLALVRQDLTEFGEAVRDEGSSLMSMTTNALRDQAGSFEAASNMMKSFVDTVSYVLFEDTTKGEELFEEPIVADSSVGAFNFETLDLEPAGNPETYALWQSTFNLREREAECERLLQSQPELLEVYQNLVTSETVVSIAFFSLPIAFRFLEKSIALRFAQTVQSSSTAHSPKDAGKKCFGGSSNDSTLEVRDDDDEGAVIVSHRAVNDQFEPQ
ncbi:hypothetical protein TTRE_0000310601 [Trichuris trichiura]|uniref:Uncharacterized protein n=1 Tax=Trichuris trichiura TaxID=36087 RepID=A0A077Z455_TRITR|nr:hypothetical protein TTRE_0000310601 [Trichuris trichiura]